MILIFFNLANNNILQEIEGQEMKRRIVEYSSYDSLYILEETLVGWERSIEQQREGYYPSLEDTLRLKVVILAFMFF